MKLGGNGVFDGLIRSVSENICLRFWSMHEFALRAVKTVCGGRGEKQFEAELDRSKIDHENSSTITCTTLLLITPSIKKVGLPDRPVVEQLCIYPHILFQEPHDSSVLQLY